MLNNMKYWLDTFLFNPNGMTISSGSADASFRRPLIDVNGTSVDKYNCAMSVAKHICVLGDVPPDNNVGMNLHFGTGKDTATNPETYSLGNPISNGLTVSNMVGEVDYPNEVVRLLIHATCTNDSGEDIEVGEVGLVLHTKGYSDTTPRQVLLDRKSVADGNFTPVTVGAGESKIFVYAIEL